MKIINLVLALAFVNVLMAQDFEGVITMNTSNAEMKEEATLTWYLKGDRSRMDIASTADGHSSKYTFLADEKGIHIVAEGHVTEVPAAALKVSNASQTLLSKEVVKWGSYNCTKAVFFDGQNQTTYWLTDDLNLTFNDLPALLKRNMPSVKSPGFPVKMEKRSADGKILVSQEVTSIKSAQVSESRFERN